MPSLPESGPAPLLAVAHVWQVCGWAGVDLFFVLSGFLVSGLLFREYQRAGRIRLGYFLIRRGLKIYPGFYVALVLTIPLALFVGIELTGWRVFVTAAFVQNYWFLDLPELWQHTWSLAVEEHFYFMIGAFLLWLTRSPRVDPFGPLRVTFVLVPLLLLGLRVLVVRHTDDFFSVFYPTHLRFDSLLFGVALAYAYHLHPERLAAFSRRWFWWLLGGGLLLVAPSLVLPVGESAFMQTGGLTALYLGFGALLLVALYWPWKVARPVDLGLSGLAAIGVYSYSIYLWHIPLRWYSESLLRMVLDHPPYLLRFGVYMVGTLGVGIFMAKLVEFPILRIRDRYFPSRSAPLGGGNPQSAVPTHSSPPAP